MKETKMTNNIELIARDLNALIIERDFYKNSFRRLEKWVSLAIIHNDGILPTAKSRAELDIALSNYDVCLGANDLTLVEIGAPSNNFTSKPVTKDGAQMLKKMGEKE